MTKKLSICMIVKDEEKNLRRCLDSLKPLLVRNDTELIVVDTGSTDDTVNIAKEYTERVYFHLWNGNFSSMRNISINYATGKWIFIMDADEELETPEKLIGLLNSQELERYNTVQIKEKNLVSVVTQKIVTHIQERLFRNDGSFKYEGSVHNQPKFKEPVLVTNIWLMHYGYVNEDTELMNKKFERTATILMEELKKDPDNIYYRFQLSRSYAMKHDFLSAYVEIKKVYKAMENNTNAILSYYYVLGEYARMCYNINKYEEAIEICNIGLVHKPQYLDLHFFRGHSYLFLNQVDKGIDAIDEYIKLAYKYLTHETELSNQDAIELYSMDSVSFDSSLERMISNAFTSRQKLDPSSSFTDDYLRFIDLIVNKNLKYNLIVKLLLINKKYKDIFNKYHELTMQEQYLFLVQLETLKKDLHKDIQLELEVIFSQADTNYGQLNKIRCSDEKHKLVLEFLNNCNLEFIPDTCIIELAQYFMDCGYLKRLFKKQSSSVIKLIVKEIIDKHEKKAFFVELLNELKFNDFQNNRLFIAIANVILLTAVEEAENRDSLYVELKDTFKEYVVKGMDYIAFLYNAEHLRLIYATLADKEEKFLAILLLANRALEAKDVGTYNKYMMEATTEYPYLSSLLKSYVSAKLEGIFHE
ncbi:glycosyltransferase [Paenibacillus filicis]|uniref:Glycosyltransferase n=1 Tax=Paenibacillus filicis TaxID=669464 RepID=A0ABU9DUA3_9BACL